MEKWVETTSEYAALLIEFIGVGIIVCTSVYSVGAWCKRAWQKYDMNKNTRELRRNLGLGVLLGLEFLVAADIIHTVAVDLTLKSIGILAAIVLIRTFLSYTMEKELRHISRSN